jgi:3D (Asp-Asp-Asp) domain-containing protein
MSLLPAPCPFARPGAAWHRIAGLLVALTTACCLVPDLPAEARTRRSRSRRVAARKKPVRKTVVATAYCLGPCRRCQTRGRTYTGARKRRGIAVARLGSRRAAPLGARMYVPGYGWARVDDVGGGVRRRQIDIRFRSHRRAARWGRRKVRVLVRR